MSKLYVPAGSCDPLASLPLHTNSLTPELDAPILSDDALLYLAEGALMRYDLSTDETELWTKVKASWPGIPQTPMVMVDSRVYFATETRGVVCMKAK